MCGNEPLFFDGGADVVAAEKWRAKPRRDQKETKGIWVLADAADDLVKVAER